MDNLATILADLSISRQILLERVKAGLARDVASIYEAMIDDITKQVKSSKPINQARLKQTIADIKSQLKSIELDLTVKYQDLAEQERDWLISSTNAAAGVSLFTTIPTIATLNTIARTSLVEGATVTAWLQSLDKSMQFDAQRAITLGVSLGETNEQLATRLADSFNINKNHAKTLAITGAAAVSNDSRFAVYDANKDVIKGWQHQSVLDSRTTKICAARDGAAWDTEYKGLNAKGKLYPFRKPALHWNCRSILTVVFKSWRELGLDIDETDTATRASMDGYLSQDITFDKWFETKSPKFQETYLGRGRYQLYKDGKITFNDLVDGKGNELTLKELRDKFS